MIFGLIKSAAAVVLVFGELMAIVWLAWVFVEKVYDAKQARKKARVNQIAENFRRATEIVNSIPCRTKDAVAAFERFGKAVREVTDDEHGPYCDSDGRMPCANDSAHRSSVNG